MDLLESWAYWQPDSAPFVLDSDREVFEEERSRDAVIKHTSWEEAIDAPDFCAPDDSRLHLGLLPQPFFGDVRHATVYILLLNPGLGPHDYYGEYQVPAYREALLANLQQRFHGGAQSFLFLDPRYSWHGGFDWWHGKLAKLIQRIASSRELSFADARAHLASVMASIELLPYHSKTFKVPARWLSTLRSVTLAREFVHDYVIPRANRGDAVVIITRKVAEWGSPHGPGVITYSGPQARAAHLTPDSPGGRAILEWLGCK